MGRKKKFIDKKNSATFQLLARDSSDPNYHDGPSGDRVFVRVDGNPYSADSFFGDPEEDVPADDSHSIFADAPDDECDFGDGSGSPYGEEAPLPNNVRREMLELGLPDDGYNYLIHLREIKNTGGGSAYYQNPKAKLNQVPRDVKAYDASRIEVPNLNDKSNEKSINSVASQTVGVRIQKAVDPEVAALLDDSDLSQFSSDVEDLEEDFVVKANLPDEPVNLELDRKLSLVEKFEMKKDRTADRNASQPQGNHATFSGLDEDRNKFPNSSEDCTNEKPRMRRLLDEQFDLLELQEYGSESVDEYEESIDEEVECQEPLAAKLNHAFKNHVIDDFELDGKYRVPSDFLHYENGEKDGELQESAADVIQRCREYAEKYESEKEGEDVVVFQESSDESEVWDCETIVSTYSNLDNHPGKIEAPGKSRKKLVVTALEASNSSSRIISLKGKEKFPVDFMSQSGKSATKKVKDVNSLTTEQQRRKQHVQESKEEKKERKAAVKEERREARRAKKEMKDLYRCEAQRAQKVAAFTGPSSIHLV